jgi:heme A synthase
MGSSFGVPAIFREAFQIRMVRIGGEIDGYIERGELPRHRYVDELRENAYRFAESPRNVSLKMLWMLYRSLATGDYFSPDDAMLQKLEFPPAVQWHHPRAHEPRVLASVVTLV